MLNEVTVRGIPQEKFAVAKKVVKIDSSIKSVYLQNNVGELLMATTPIYLRSYGAGMASGISFRGTSPNHTGIYWNGLNINSRTLGQSDLSLLPVTGADEITVQYGASSSLYGSDAIGGSVHLNSNLDYNGPERLLISQSVGSYGLNQTSGALAINGNGISSKTRAYYQQADNDFSYELPLNKNIYKQNNAAIEFYGISQDLGFQLSSHQLIEISGWYNHNFRQIQPVIGNFTASTVQEDESLRLTAAYINNADFGLLRFRTGFIQDDQLYDRSSRVKANQIINQAQLEKKFGKISVSGGVNWNHIEASGDNYSGKPNEDRIDVFFLTVADFDSWKVSLNARENFVSTYSSAFSPSLSVEQKVCDNLKLTYQLSRNYRVPTMNDRYWSPGGNRDIQPELSYNAEAGLEFHYSNFKVSANAYHMWVEDWIIWVPESTYWTPKNIREVKSKGIETDLSYSAKINQLSFKILGGFALSKAENTNAIDGTDRSQGEQLPYTPKHNAYGSIFTKWKDFYLTISSRFTGERKTLGNTSLDSYILADANLGYNIKTKAGNFNAGFTAKNIFNTEYQPIINYAMPGRNYQITINYNLQFNQK